MSLLPPQSAHPSPPTPVRPPQSATSDCLWSAFQGRPHAQESPGYGIRRPDPRRRCLRIVQSRSRLDGPRSSPPLPNRRNPSPAADSNGNRRHVVFEYGDKIFSWPFQGDFAEADAPPKRSPGQANATGPVHAVGPQPAVVGPRNCFRRRPNAGVHPFAHPTLVEHGQSRAPPRRTTRRRRIHRQEGYIPSPARSRGDQASTDPASESSARQRPKDWPAPAPEHTRTARRKNGTFSRPA